MCQNVQTMLTSHVVSLVISLLYPVVKKSFQNFIYLLRTSFSFQHFPMRYALLSVTVCFLSGTFLSKKNIIKKKGVDFLYLPLYLKLNVVLLHIFVKYNLNVSQQSS